ncbi:hypothetical protein ACWDRB_44910 [Nonomuraea sp. NPDC003707]
MSADDQIRSWKTPELRGHDEAHPAGEINLGALSGGEKDTPIFSDYTDFFSCWQSCERSMWVGTCRFSSLGCC